MATEKDDKIPLINGIINYQDSTMNDIPSEPDPDDSEPEEATTKTDRYLHRLMHRRFGHYGPNLIGKIRQVSSLKRKIPISPPGKRV